jgi:hypothetical protein
MRLNYQFNEFTALLATPPPPRLLVQVTLPTSSAPKPISKVPLVVAQVVAEVGANMERSGADGRIAGPRFGWRDAAVEGHLKSLLVYLVYFEVKIKSLLRAPHTARLCASASLRFKIFRFKFVCFVSIRVHSWLKLFVPFVPFVPFCGYPISEFRINIVLFC